MSIREILKQLILDVCNSDILMEDAYSQALALIKSEVEGCVPEVKQGIKHKEFPMENGSQYSPTDNRKIGFNDCRSQTLSALEKLFK